jgi:hypothetical protein
MREASDILLSWPSTKEGQRTGLCLTLSKNQEPRVSLAHFVRMGAPARVVSAAMSWLQ